MPPEGAAPPAVAVPRGAVVLSRRGLHRAVGERRRPVGRALRARHCGGDGRAHPLSLAHAEGRLAAGSLSARRRGLPRHRRLGGRREAAAVEGWRLPVGRVRLPRLEEGAAQGVALRGRRRARPHGVPRPALVTQLVSMAGSRPHVRGVDWLPQGDWARHDGSALAARRRLPLRLALRVAREACRGAVGLAGLRRLHRDQQPRRADQLVLRRAALGRLAAALPAAAVLCILRRPPAPLRLLLLRLHTLARAARLVRPARRLLRGGRGVALPLPGLWHRRRGDGEGRRRRDVARAAAAAACAARHFAGLRSSRREPPQHGGGRSRLSTRLPVWRRRRRRAGSAVGGRHSPAGVAIAAAVAVAPFLDRRRPGRARRAARAAGARLPCAPVDSRLARAGW
mmetsp:Transcript_31763/g.104004  ORF Transcript_31763/g.104004 Transcript_31763/m.104004 type:complete len:397 (-) Transcript_31763:197-1387(-)